MTVDARLAQKIKEKKIMFSPGVEIVKETGIGIYIETTWKGLPTRVRIGGVNYRTKNRSVEDVIKTDDPELKEVVEKLNRIISEKLKTNEDAYKSLETLEKEMKKRGIELRRVCYGKEDC